MSEEQIRQVADLITANTIFTTKEVLTSDEAAAYMGVSKSHLYKLTMRGEVPHYKPTGKMVYFNRQELEAWLQSNRVATATELADVANRHCMKGGQR
ncbi:MAG: helix-turn-helix domain-containing protein [Muribaculaceae bacterium]